MSKAEIMQELPKLGAEDRRKVLDLICDLEERDIPGEVFAEEKQMLDEELKEYRANPKAGSAWQEVEARLCKQD